jgi:hypothetical protein
MSVHEILCEMAEQKVCNILVRSIAGQRGTLIAKADPEFMTDWLSWRLGNWVAVCTVRNLDDPDEEVTEFEVCLRNAATSEEVSRRFDSTGGEIKHAHFWVLKCIRDAEYRKQWEPKAPGIEE